MTDPDAWICRTCNVAVTTPYCPHCGERRLHARDMTLRGLLKKAVQIFTNLDARLIRTVTCLVRRPGVLTTLYLQGPRMPYIGPLALFLLANVMFVGMESVTGSNAFSAPLESHLHKQPWSPLVQPLVAHRLAATHLALHDYAAEFDPAVAAHSKSLIILMALAFALPLPLVFRRQSRPLLAHVVFSLHFHAFLLLLMSVALLLPFVDVLLGGPGLASRMVDNALALALLLICGVYLYLAIGPVYGARGVVRVQQAVLLSLVAMLVFLGYRFVLLLITLQLT